MDKIIEIMVTIGILAWIGLYFSVVIYATYEVFKNLINKLRK